jgi:hypothetical protein
MNNGRTLHRGTGLIEVSDPLLLAEIENDDALKPFLGDRLTERCIAVQPQAVMDVVRRLRHMGHMPRVIE